MIGKEKEEPHGVVVVVIVDENWKMVGKRKKKEGEKEVAQL